MGSRLKSCGYCGKVHAGDCDRKPKRKKRGTDEDKFRWSQPWIKKRNEIRERDKQLCQVCIRQLYGTQNRYNFTNLSVHHIVPLKVDFNKRLDNDNLITICEYHHELAERGKIPRVELLMIAIEQEKKRQ